MIALRACLTSLLCALLLALPSPATSAQDVVEPAETAIAASETPAAEVPMPLPEHVLFIGNSHTSRHGGLDWLIENFVAAEDEPREFDGSIMAEGGVTLEYHWNNGARQRIREGGFDTVVLQEYLPGISTRTAEPFIEHARLLDEVIEDAGAETVFFMTWPRGFNDWSTVQDVMVAHRQVSAELGARVAPAAVAFELARAERPDLALIDEDQVHATWEGAYLAAATVYATLFERSPEGLAYTFGLDPDDAAFLQGVAWRALQAWQDGSAESLVGG